MYALGYGPSAKVRLPAEGRDFFFSITFRTAVSTQPPVQVTGGYILGGKSAGARSQPFPST
jgi:hypothetical protein